MWLVYAACSAVAFGLRGILYQRLSPLPLDRNVLLSGVFFTGFLISLTLAFLNGQAWEIETAVGIQMGVCSYVANMAMYRGFAAGKPSIVAVLSALPPVVVVLVAWLLWGERLNFGQSAAFLLIVAGVVLIRYARDFTLAHWNSAKWGLVTMLFFGFNDLSSKWSTMLGADLYPVLACMFGTGTVLFLLSRRAGKRRSADALVRPAGAEPPANAWTERRTFGVGMLVGLTNAVGMILIVTAFETGITGLVSAIVALNVLLILLYTRIVVRERFSPREAAGILLTVGGVITLRLLA
ncbi:MAG: EamA family transporter [Thermobacillus sp.]|uniref:Putative membrane protein n=1 Tax=Thermobacillus composti (strain DSM 18247 / JCM 13945 / KWC4) TaxID=717605 RepID=L0EFR0_THECK|nr:MULTISPECIES: EamA family transporter [Thermobacillus]AGA58642.1 putative membrane protein [Thermobacillus composti KWC4]REK53015.1 MAG: EamA family transporter [Thermobacillus sp.]